MNQVDNILKGFTKVLGQLEAFMTKSDVTIQNNEDTIRNLSRENAETRADITRAYHAAEKIREITGNI